ncbi:hypothetical protein LC609_07170 [Nostoc sp. XA013]|nr:hypothetical protein [Nostoc sp. XA013]
MGHEFPEDSKTSGTEAVITVSRQIVEVSGGEQVVKFDVCNWNTFHKDLEFFKEDSVIHPPARA